MQVPPNGRQHPSRVAGGPGRRQQTAPILQRQDAGHDHGQPPRSPTSPGEVWEGKIVKPLPTDSIRLYHCPFQELRGTAGLRSKSVHLILTDIPYGKEFLAELDDLGRFAKEVLVEGGLFITFCGQYYLDQCFRILGEHLTYRWTLASVWERDANVIHPLAIMSRWKPILLYSKGAYRRTTGRRSDLLLMPHKEKGLHEWQQPVGIIEELIKNLSDPGQLVVDPCGGSFTTALACHNLSRRFVGCDSDVECVAAGQRRLGAGSQRHAAGSLKSNALMPRPRRP